jgi:hypothetical protein
MVRSLPLLSMESGNEFANAGLEVGLFASIGFLVVVRQSDTSRATAGWVWPAAGALCVLIAALVIIPPGHDVAKRGGSGIFEAADGFAALAGFTFLAAALERIAQFTLAPWWGTVNCQPVMDAVRAASALPDSLVAGVPQRVGVAGAARLRAKIQDVQPSPEDDDAQTMAEDAAAKADSVYVAATKQRPTIMLQWRPGPRSSPRTCTFTFCTASLSLGFLGPQRRL